MIYVNDKIYSFTLHFEDQLLRRGILLEWVEAVLLNPINYELSNASGHYVYDGYVPNRTELLRVVVDEDTALIVTTFFVSRGLSMKITYDQQADAMFIRFNDQEYAKTQVINDLINLDFSADGTLIGIELLRTSRFSDDIQEIVYRVVGDKPAIEKVKA